MTDYLIVGQGIAGSFLAWNLLQQGKSVVIIDNSHFESSSMVSAGIINPITGRRFALTDEFLQYFEFAQQVYGELEKLFGQKFFEVKPILRAFQNQDEYDHCLRKYEQNLLADYLESFNKPRTYSENMNDALGSIVISKAGFCHAARILKSFKEFFIRQKVLIQQKFVYDDLKIRDDHVQFQGDKFHEVIFCEGHQARFNPWFQHVSFNCVKGEILRIEMEAKDLPDCILNKGKWCVPLGSSRWNAGATYDLDNLDCKTTEEGRQEILAGLNAFLSRDIKVVDHQAGIRPVLENQKPILEQHPEMPYMSIFNGLGSKGFLLAPYLAAH